MISKKMEEALNQQIEFEGYASFLYLSMATWCDNQGLNGCADFLKRQSEEERMHMLKIFEYLSDVDGFALTPGIKEPPRKFDTVQLLFKEVYEHEQKVTQSINKLITLANKEDDHGTQTFLQWYINEQREEEALMRTVLDRIRLIGDGTQSLYFIDKEMEAINQAAIAAEAAGGGAA
ncbi:MAG: ferritin [Saprospiraceae bacterium]|nr:ferritin [Saprospiraceae bacterium]MCF8251301.1 ferritin [Saprospiraceae bacterium]MCF8313176.1 ferritin [Saprospiraceae bacterium]MCF8441660.1 ferritin [Saprospiraceae bacterium]